MSLEELRACYRPAVVRALFVGESPPVGGVFFYCGNSNLARYTCEALLGRPCTRDELNGLPANFSQRGFYLVDLCLEPVNGLSKSERRLARAAGVDQLANVMREVNPASIIVVMKGIESSIHKAVARAELSHLPFHVLPFPSHGHQRRYVQQLSELLRNSVDFGG